MASQEEMCKVFYDPSVDDEELHKILKSIEDESIQLNKYLSEEKILVSEICELLRKIIKHLRISIEIPPSHLPVKDKPKKILLNDKGNLDLYYGKGHVVSKTLDECKPEIVMAVIWEVLPKLQRVIRRYEHKVQKRINHFERIKSELKSIFKTLIPTHAHKVGSII